MIPKGHGGKLVSKNSTLFRFNPQMAQSKTVFKLGQLELQWNRSVWRWWNINLVWNIDKFFPWIREYQWYLITCCCQVTGGIETSRLPVLSVDGNNPTQDPWRGIAAWWSCLNQGHPLWEDFLPAWFLPPDLRGKLNIWDKHLSNEYLWYFPIYGSLSQWNPP